MFPHVISAEHVERQVVRLRFDDGLEGIIDLAPFLKGPIFEPIRNEAEFARLRVDTRAGTICWPNGADIAPEFLHAKLLAAIAAE